MGEAKNEHVVLGTGELFEQVPREVQAAGFTGIFEEQVAGLAVECSKSAVAMLTRIG